MDSRSDSEGEIGIQFGKMSAGYRSSTGKFYLKGVSVKEFKATN